APCTGRGRAGSGTFTGDGGAPRNDGSSVRGVRGFPLSGGMPSSVTVAVIVTGAPARGGAIGSIFTTGGPAFGVSSLLTWTPPLFETSTLRSISQMSSSVAFATSVLPLATMVQASSFFLSQSFGTLTLKRKWFSRG